MSRRVSVRVPSTRVEGGDVIVGDRWLTASFALDASRPRLVERGGTLAGDTTRDEDDPVLRAARRACIEAGREPPPALRVRVVSQIPLAADNGAVIAAAAAGALGARELLGLLIDDEVVARITADIDGGDRRRALQAIAAHTVVAQQACDD